MKSPGRDTDKAALMRISLGYDEYHISPDKAGITLF
jgi:hypothetical protein